MIDKSDGKYIKDNRGLSLVELIVAVAIGVIVAGSIAALMTFAIRMYRNESVNTEMQYELQTNINTIMDEIMAAQGLLVMQNTGVDIDHVNKPGDVKDPYTHYAMFGKFAPTTIGGGSSGVKFSGVIFASSDPDPEGKFSIYMNRVVDVSGASVSGVATSCLGTISSNPDVYLLGENATQFVIKPDPNNTSFISGEYINPIEVRVILQFEKDGWGGKKYSKHVDDIAYLRNKLKDTIYVNSDQYTLKKKDD